MTNRFDLTGRVALVTGAAAGIGRAAAEVFIEAGCHVHLFDRDADVLARTQAELSGKGPEVTMSAGDVRESAALDAAVAAILARHGRLDIAVPNAGIGDPDRAPLHETTDAGWDTITGVNLDGVFYTCRAALRPMLQQKSGSIITIASIFGLVAASGMLERPGYAATKGAVVNLTRDMAVSYAKHGIRVNAICPGAIRTPNRPKTQELAAIMEAYAPMGRIGSLEEIKGPLLFLASDASSYMTGSMVVVDGGVTAM
jgi:gluconate 5-dehydrogenase